MLPWFDGGLKSRETFGVGAMSSLALPMSFEIAVFEGGGIGREMVMSIWNHAALLNEHRCGERVLKVLGVRRAVLFCAVAEWRSSSEDVCTRRNDERLHAARRTLDWGLVDASLEPHGIVGRIIDVSIVLSGNCKTLVFHMDVRFFNRGVLDRYENGDSEENGS